MLDELLFILVIAVGSIVSSILIVSTFYCFPHLRDKSSILIVILSIASLGSNVITVCALALSRDHQASSSSLPSINILNFLGIFFNLSMILWSVTFTHTIAVVSMRRNMLMGFAKNQECRWFGSKRIVRYNAIIWISAATFSAFPCGFNALNFYPGTWKWFTPDRRAELVGLLCYFVPISLTMLCNIYVQCYLHCQNISIRVPSLSLRTVLVQDDLLTNELDELISILGPFPCIAIANSLSILTVGIIQKASGNGGFTWMNFVVAVLQQSQGMFILVAYCSRGAVRNAWSRRILGQSTNSNESGIVVAADTTSNSFNDMARSSRCDSNHRTSIDSNPDGFLSSSSSPSPSASLYLVEGFHSPRQSDLFFSSPFLSRQNASIAVHVADSPLPLASPSETGTEVRN